MIAAHHTEIQEIPQLSRYYSVIKKYQSLLHSFVMQGQVETLDTYIPRGINHNTHGNCVLFEFPWKQCLWHCSVIREKNEL